MRYEYLDHTADAKFIAYGDSLEEAFTNSAYAMENILVGDEKVQSKIKRTIKAESESKENLLYDFLDELLFLLDTESLLLSKIEDLKIEAKNNRYILECKATFDNASGYDISGNIKSVTHSEMKIEESDGNFKIQVVVDI